MTEREIIAKVREHFSRPDAQYGYDAESACCVYRLDNDPASPVRCAVGVLIPDEAYVPEIESCVAPTLVASGVYTYENDEDKDGTLWRLGDLVELPGDAGLFLRQLQIAHDDRARDGMPMSSFLAYLDAVEAGLS